MKSLMSVAQLQYELAHYSMCGKQPDPAELQPEKPYAVLMTVRVEAALAFIRQREPWSGGAKSVPYIGLINAGPKQLVQALTRVLTQLHHQHEVVAADGTDLFAYPLLILPSPEDIPHELWPPLCDYVRSGGNLFSEIHAGNRVPEMERIAGVNVIAGKLAGTNGYILLEEQVRARSPARPSLVKGPFFEISASGAEVVAKLIFPWGRMAEGYLWGQAPPDREAQTPAAIIRCYGQGRVLYVAMPILAGLRNTSFSWLFEIVDDLLRVLLRDPPFLIEGPPTLEANLLWRDNELLLHLVNYYPNRPLGDRLVIEEIVPLRNVHVRIRSPRPIKVKMQPNGVTLPFEYRRGYLSVTLPVIKEYEVLQVMLPKD